MVNDVMIDIFEKLCKHEEFVLRMLPGRRCLVDGGGSTEMKIDEIVHLSHAMIYLVLDIVSARRLKKVVCGLLSHPTSRRQYIERR